VDNMGFNGIKYHCRIDPDFHPSWGNALKWTITENGIMRRTGLAKDMDIAELQMHSNLCELHILDLEKLLEDKCP